MSIEPASSTPSDLTDEIRRTAARAARESCAETVRQRAATEVRQTAEAQRTKTRRRQSLLGALVATFALLSTLNLTGHGLLRTPRPLELTEETLDLYLREELLFGLESVELFELEEGRVPATQEELGYPEDDDLAYEWLGPGAYRLTISDSEWGRKLSYQTGMDRATIFGEWIDD